MNKNELMISVSRTFNNLCFKARKHSPEILVAAGVIGTVATTIVACRATTKASAIISEAKTSLDAIHDCMANEALADKYTKEDSRKDLTMVYTKTAVEFGKLYAPTVILGAASISCILASHNILRKRNAAIAAAYATVEKGYKEYRGRVIERFGEVVDRELKYNIKAKEIEETVINEKGEEEVVKKTVEVVDIDGYSEYARFFDEASPYWEKDSEYNLMFLRAEQNYANDRLRANGRVFLNEVYERLGIEKTKAGQVVGWVYDPDNGDGDNYIDFGIYDCRRDRARAFVNGYERCILLDFNVDGNIWEQMK